MEDDEFEARLRGSAPTARVPLGLADHRARILAEARRRRWRRLRALGAGTAVSVLLVGGGATAIAGNGNETPWGWVADNVFSIERESAPICFQGMRVMLDGVADDSEMAQDARQIVGEMNLEDVDTAAAEAEIRKQNAEEPDGTLAEVSDAQIKQDALHQIVADTLFAELDARGYDLVPGAWVSLQSTVDCADE